MSSSSSSSGDNPSHRDPSNVIDHINDQKTNDVNMMTAPIMEQESGVDENSTTDSRTSAKLEADTNNSESAKSSVDVLYSRKDNSSYESNGEVSVNCFKKKTLKEKK